MSTRIVATVSAFIGVYLSLSFIGQDLSWIVEPSWVCAAEECAPTGGFLGRIVIVAVAGFTYIFGDIFGFWG